MRSSWRSRVIAGLVAAAVAGTAPALSAHRRDQYLQAARLALDPGRVQIELDLTPGIDVADVVLADIDSDRTRTISADEARAYVAIVRGAIGLDVDGTAVPVLVVGERFPAVEAMMRGEGVIRITLAATLPPLPPGVHHLRFRNAHRPDISAYLANVLVPASDLVAVSGQRRDVDQRELVIDYVLRADPSAGARRWLIGGGAGVLLLGAVIWWWRSSRPTSAEHRS